MKEIYFDNNATTRPLPEVREAMMDVLDSGFGNPSSGHSAGERARNQVIIARESLADLIGTDPDNVFFTSGATESNNMVFSSIIKKYHNYAGLLTTKVEHSSIKKFCESLKNELIPVNYVPIDKKGHVSLSELENMINSETRLVSIQWVNNETGVIQPVREIGEICKKKGVLFHTDAAQAIGKVSINLNNLSIDFLSISGHKFHGPQGIGAIFAKAPNLLSSILQGGPQEYGLRPGTENVPGIVGLGKAAKLRKSRFNEIEHNIGKLRDTFEEMCLTAVSMAEINGDKENRAFNTTNILFREIDGQALVARLDQNGIRCSQSSACTNQYPEPSYVLREMGLDEDDAYSSVRFSFSELNSLDEVEWAVKVIADICRNLRPYNISHKK